LKKVCDGWLVKQFTILGGIPFQSWMSLAFAVILLRIFIAWLQRIESAQLLSVRPRLFARAEQRRLELIPRPSGD
jgi:hypothetical protein